MIYTVFKTVVLITLLSGEVESTKLTFQSEESCQSVQTAVELAGFEASDCYPVSVWSGAGPDGYDPTE